VTAARTLLLVASLLPAPAVLGQRGAGELRLSVMDATGSGLEAAVELVGQATQVRLSFQTAPDGRSVVKALPFGPYTLRVSRDGFTAWAAAVEIRSEVPLEKRVTLSVAPIETTVTVMDSSTLLDPRRTNAAVHLGSDTLRERRGAAPGRAVLDLVQTTPGWLLEANGVLHPRGSEYATQYVVDGIPITDNRSPAFAPSLGIESLQSLTVLTAGYPAEYGRKLGGVIEVQEARDTRPGAHGSLAAEGGSFGSVSGQVSGQYAFGANVAGFSAEAARTDRFLDPPVEENFTNTASHRAIGGRYERDLTEQNRLRLTLYHRRAGFALPNDREQQRAGQRQDRANSETIGQASFQAIFSPRLVGNFRGMARDLTATLWSNALATPIRADQERGFREGYAAASLAYHRGSHELKFGADGVFASISESFGYQRADHSRFDGDLPMVFRFDGRRQGREQSIFVQDLIRAGRWTLSAGLRWDHYRLVVDETAVSPRLGAAYGIPEAGLAIRASYDRAFQTPASENLLLASSQAAQRLTEETTGLPVRPSRGDFYQAGFAKSLFGKLRLDAAYFRRNQRHFADDDVFLNTGVSFPIAFDRAEVHGFEGRLEIPRWGPMSGAVSYANLVGHGRLPITGGLFLEEGADEMLRSTDSFRISQDQRNTVSARFRFQLGPRAWMAVGFWYGSGLPVEREGDGDLSGFDTRILQRVDLGRGRVRPAHSLDLSAGADLWKRGSQTIRVQGDVLNLSDRLNVINFTGLFSGTALAPPRAVSLRLKAEF
jgi:hypothetical protein